MEIIGLIVLGLISMLFNKLGNRQEETPPRQQPVRPNQQPNRPKRLEDYAKDLFEEFQEPQRRNPEPNRPVETRIPPRIEPKKAPVQEKVQVDVESSRRQPIRRAASKKMEQPSSVLPSTQQELLQAFIFSEVIGPPKSKR